MTRSSRRRQVALSLALVAAATTGISLLALVGPAAERGACADDAKADRIPKTAWCPAQPGKDAHVEVPRGLPSPWIPPSNPLTPEKVALGRRLFYETAMSRDGTKSCAHCHLPEAGLGDGRPTAVGVRGQVGGRNVPTLWNAAIYPALFWDGRAVSLEAQAEGPLLAPTELDVTEDLLVERISSNAEYAPLFLAAFGSKTVTLRRLAYALASFERTLLAADSPFDHWWFGKQKDAMPEPARRGYELFRTKAACAGCHSVRPAEAAFSDFEFHRTGTVAEGATDVGRFAVTGREDDRGKFRTPSLRNAALTGPYFHDGSAKTLGDVIEHYDRGGKPVAGTPSPSPAPALKSPPLDIGPLHLSAAEKADLLAFLGSLTSPTAAAAFVPGTVAKEPPPAATPNNTSDTSDATLLARPEAARDPRRVRIAAEDVLEKSPKDAQALRALLIAVTRMGDPNLLDDAIDRAQAASSPDFAAALGAAIVARVRQEEPWDAARLREAERLLAPAEGADGRPEDAIHLAYARHMLGDVPSAKRAYERALDGDETLAERALKGLGSVLGGETTATYAAALDDLGKRRPGDPVVLRARADAAERGQGREAAIALLVGAPAVVEKSPRTAMALATRLRSAERHDEALALERRALEHGAADKPVLSAIETIWRETRPLASFADVAALDADMERLLAAVDADPFLAMAYRNDFAFRFREVCASFAWRGEARTQALAEGAPKEARALLDRVVALYEQAVARIPDDAAGRPFPERWVYAAVCNDAGLMRHYWLDVRDLDRAEALYLRAFELTDGAYMDTYFYNLQYLFGFERPGNEERWFRLARRAADAILKEGPGGTFVPDDGKREAARRDAEGLKKLLEERDAAMR